MFSILNKINNVLDNDADPRTSSFFLVSPLPFLLSLCIYLLVVKVILPLHMRKREPYNLTNVLIVYNSVQVIASGYLFYLAAECWFFLMKATFWQCNLVDKTNNPGAMKAATSLYLYFLSKYTEFFDTIFFVLRKKDNQVSFLHIYHHVSTPAFVWFVVRYYPGGSFIFLSMFNTFIHIIMYTYYLLSAFGSRMEKYLWWKKYLTTLQLAQFVICLTHFVFATFSSECNIPIKVLLSIVINCVVLYILFANFYSRQYGKDEKRMVGKEINPPLPLGRKQELKIHHGE